MSEPTKGLPSDDGLARMAEGHAYRYASAMAAEIIRLRAELAKASAEVKKPAPFSQCSDGWGYAISSIGWDDFDCPSRISVTRTDGNGRTQVLDFVEPNRFLAGKKPHQFTGAEALAPSYEASQAAKVEEWNTTTDDCPVSTQRLAELRTSYAAGATKESMSEPTRSRCRDAVKALDELLEVRAAKDAPPADGLGEAFHKHLSGILDGDSGLDKRFAYTYHTVLELSQVVERIARQGGGK